MLHVHPVPQKAYGAGPAAQRTLIHKPGRAQPRPGHAYPRRRSWKIKNVCDFYCVTLQAVQGGVTVREPLPPKVRI